MKLFNIIILLLVFFLLGCSSVNFSSRKGKDFELNENNYTLIEGSYSNNTIDTLHKYRTLLSEFQFDTISNHNNYKVRIVANGNRMLEFKFINTDTLISSFLVKGRYKRGYFKAKTEWGPGFIAGPLLWTLGDRRKYIGITKNNNLVVLTSYGGMMFLTVLPIFAAGGQYEAEYLRMK